MPNPVSAALEPGGPAARTATQDAINRSCLLAQTSHYRSPKVNSEPAAGVDLPRHGDDVLSVDELDGDNLTEMLRLPIRSNFRVLARINQILRDSPDLI